MKQELTKIDYQRSSLSTKEWIVCVIEIVVIISVVNYLCYRTLWFFLLGIPFGYWYVGWKKKSNKVRRHKLLECQFYDVLQGLNTAIRTGYSMEKAVTECRKEMQQIYGNKSDFVTELLYMEKQMRVGVPVEQLFLDLGYRCDVEDIRYFGEIFQINRRSGGNLAQMIDKLAKVLGEKSQVKRDIDVAISGKKFEQTIMSFVPGGIIVYMQMTSDGFLDVLYHNAFGVGVMSVCLMVYLFSFWLGRRIVRISI